MNNRIADSTITQVFILALLSSVPFVAVADVEILGDVLRLNPDSLDVRAVGQTGTGTLNINSGSTIVSGNSVSLGENAGSNGTVTVDGAGSSWTIDNHLDVGRSGTGTLNIKNGGVVVTDNGVSLGENVGSNGTVTVDGAGSSWNTGNGLNVGRSGTGTLNIKNGGVVVSGNGGSVGTGVGSNGTVTVDGIGSSWTITANGLSFGRTGKVNLNGGTINASLVRLNGGTLTGSGIINGGVSNDGGIVGPGNSPGTLTVDDYRQGIDSRLNIELGGTLAGTEFNVLEVIDGARLGGRLNVDFSDLGSGLFDASLGDTFNILLAESLFGEFDVLTLALLGDGLDWQLDYLIDFQGTTDVVQLSVVSAVPVPAAVWLFGSGLIGLIGFARRKKVII